MKPSKLEIPSINDTEQTKHGCLWHAKLIGIEARRAGDGGRYVWQLFTFKCELCSCEFRGSRTYYPGATTTYHDSHLDPQWLLESRQFVIDSMGIDNIIDDNLFALLWPHSLAVLGQPEYAQLRPLTTIELLDRAAKEVTPTNG